MSDWAIARSQPHSLNFLCLVYWLTRAMMLFEDPFNKKHSFSLSIDLRTCWFNIMKFTSWATSRNNSSFIIGNRSRSVLSTTRITNLKLNKKIKKKEETFIKTIEFHLNIIKSHQTWWGYKTLPYKKWIRKHVNVLLFYSGQIELSNSSVFFKFLV